MHTCTVWSDKPSIVTPQRESPWLYFFLCAFRYFSAISSINVLCFYLGKEDFVYDYVDDSILSANKLHHYDNAQHGTKNVCTKENEYIDISKDNKINHNHETSNNLHIYESPKKPMTYTPSKSDEPKAFLTKKCCIIVGIITLLAVALVVILLVILINDEDGEVQKYFSK